MREFINRMGLELQLKCYFYDRKREKPVSSAEAEARAIDDSKVVHNLHISTVCSPLERKWTNQHK